MVCDYSNLDAGSKFVQQKYFYLYDWWLDASVGVRLFKIICYHMENKGKSPATLGYVVECGSGFLFSFFDLHLTQIARLLYHDVRHYYRGAFSALCMVLWWKSYAATAAVIPIGSLLITLNFDDQQLWITPLFTGIILSILALIIYLRWNKFANSVSS